MRLVGTLWVCFSTSSNGALETGDAFRNRGRGLDSPDDTRVERKVARRQRATRELVNEETMRDEVKVGAGVMAHDFANGEDNAVFKSLIGTLIKCPGPGHCADPLFCKAGFFQVIVPESNTQTPASELPDWFDSLG